MRQLPKFSTDLKSLVHVIYDEQIEDQWLDIKASSISSLWVEVAEEHFMLDSFIIFMKRT